LSPLRFALLGAALLATAAVAQERHLYTLQLRHVVPEQVVPALQPLLSAGSSLSHYHNQLILNATPEEHRQLQQVLQQLDAAPQALLISVRKQSEWSAQRQRIAVDGSVGDERVQVRTGRPVADGARVQVQQQQRTGGSDGTQQVRATEGLAAYIGTGIQAPVVVGRYSYGGEHRELAVADSGFYASARVVDGEVIVDIDQRDDRLRGGTIRTQGLQTQVRGRLGEWIPLGGIDRSGDSSERGLARYGDSASSSLSDIAIKVELAQ
jgi:hypothetical protein